MPHMTNRPIEPTLRWEDHLEHEARELAAFIERVGPAFLRSIGFELPQSPTNAIEG